MRVGCYCYATDQGLGVLAKSFYDAGVVTDMCIVPQTPRRPTHLEWYPGASIVSPGDIGRLRSFCLRVQTVLFFETPFNWELITFCKENGVRTVLIPMHECMPTVWPTQPDAVINPSDLEQQLYPTGVRLDVPVSMKWRRREKAHVFVHNAGHGGLRGRNGTMEVLEAWNYVRSPAKLIVRSQERAKVYTEDERIELRTGTFPYSTLFEEGDVFLFPEKFNGLSLPLQEACAAGMLVMATDRFPMNAWLPKEPLIRVREYIRTRVAARFQEYTEAVIEPSDIARKVDEWYGREIGSYSDQGFLWSESASWEKLRPKYLEVLHGGQ